MLLRPICLLIASLLLIAAPAHAQIVAAPDEPSAASAATPDPLGRDTPRGTVDGLLKALAQRDYERAGQYLKPSDREVQELRAAQERVARAQQAPDIAPAGPEEPESAEAASSSRDNAPADAPSGAVPPSDTELPVSLSERAVLARTFQALLDRAGVLAEFTALSSRPEGATNDGYPADIEEVGVFRGKRPIPILLARDLDESTGRLVWRLSRQTISDFQRVVPPEVQQVLIEKVEQEEPGLLVRGAPVQDWIQLLAIAFLCFFAFYLVAQAVLFGLRRMIAIPERSPLYALVFTVLPPSCLLFAVAAFQIITNRIEISIVAQQSLLRYNGILGWVAVLWFAMRVIDSLARLALSRLEERQARQSKGAISLIERTVKLIILAFGAFVILDALGFDVTTGLAALGVGGLAIALGAQKTIENLVGSVTVVADRPIQIGDFCEIGNIQGIVEDIGIRSTRIRTLDRTVVSIPNADLASQQINNLSARDRFRFAPVIRLENRTEPADVRLAIAGIAALLAAHPAIDQTTSRVLLADFGDGSLDIEVQGYILVSDFVESRHVRNELLLGIVELLAKAGIRLAERERPIRLQTDGSVDVSAEL